MTKLLRNPQFELVERVENPLYVQNPLCIQGFLPINGVTLRRSSKKGQMPKNFDRTQFLKKGEGKNGKQF